VINSNDAIKKKLQNINYKEKEAWEDPEKEEGSYYIIYVTGPNRPNSGKDNDHNE
jgi:hypothetical protein